MSRIAGLGAGPAIGIGAVIIAAVAVLAAYFLADDTPPPPETVLSAGQQAAPETRQQVPPEIERQAAETGAAGQQEAAAAPPAARTEEAADAGAEAKTVAPARTPAPAPSPPALDTFRLAPDGQMLVSGRAMPGGKVAITVDDARLGTTEADGAGKFVAFFDLAQSDRARVLGLELLLEDGSTIRAPEEILIAPSPPPAAQPQTVAKADTPPPLPASGPAKVPTATPDAVVAETAPEAAAAQPEVPPTGVTGAVTAEMAGDTPAPQGAARGPDEAGSTESATESAAEPATAPATAPTVMLSDAEGVRVLQTPGAQGDAKGDALGPEAMSSVALDSISYSEAGVVQLAGRAGTPDSRVRIYLDNRAIATAPVDQSGAWRSALPEVDTGTYTLRVDEVATGGEVTSRVETPFKREDVAMLAARNETGHPAPPRMSVVTVQPGSTLWAISREAYGEGILYVRVFEANRNRIRDPDLIYPGQVFELPQ